MGVFRHFPYSNFHEMNMDEIIKIVKDMLEDWAQYYAEWDAWMDQMNDDWSNYQEVMNTAWQNMQDFINNYFDNLDVQNEINAKITSMVNSGEFAQIVDPFIPPAVATWLSAHITQPVGVVIDTSLSVSGACADAKVTGDGITNNTNETIDFTIRSNELLEKGSVNLVDYFTLEPGGINSDGLNIDTGDYPKRLRSSNYLRIDGTAYVTVTHNYYRLIFFAYDPFGNYVSQIQKDDNGEYLYNSQGMFANVPVTFDKTKRYRVMIWDPKDTTIDADSDYVTITQNNNRLTDFDYYKETSLEPFLDTFLPFRIGSFVPSDTAEFEDNLLLLTRCAVKFRISKPTKIVVSDPDYAFMLYIQDPTDFSYTPIAWQYNEYSISDTSKIYYMLVKSDSISDLTSYVSYVSSIIHLRYSDKNIFEICFPRYRGLMSTVGDSYTASKRWQPTAIKDLCIEDYEVTAVIGGMLTGMYTSISNVDLDSEVVTIWFGTNDYSNNRLLGDVTTPTADGTTTPQETYFWGALKYVCEWLGTNLPTAKILFITHTQRWETTVDLQFIEDNGYNNRGFIKNNLGYSLEDYTNAVCECASLYGYDYLDLFHMSGVNKFNGASFYESDMLHPTSASGIKIGHMIADKLKSIN